MGSRLLSTMAVVRATADEGRDYLSYLEPFVIDRLKEWPTGTPVTSDRLAEGLCSEFGFPTVPVSVADLLIRRADDQGLVISVEGRIFPDQASLNESPGMSTTRTRILGEMNALADAVVEYAKDQRELDWTPDDASAALEELTEEFGVDLALAKRHGALSFSAQGKGALSVIHGFALHALERDPTSFGYLENMVKGTMLMNALYFDDVRATVNRLPDLNVYIDTTPLLRALGMAPPELRDAAREMLGLLHEFRVKTWVFPHTLDEMTGVLDAIAGALRRGRRGFREQARVGGRNREAIDALIKQGTTPGEIESLIAELEPRLRDLGVTRKETPPHAIKGHIDEGRFDTVLDEVVEYRSSGPRDKDLKSLAAVDRFRGQVRPRDLGAARALFVTSNSALVRASRKFFREEDRDAPVGHAMQDVALTAQLWVRSSNRRPDLPRQLLIADAYAALNPAPQLWERYVGHIIRLREAGEVTDEQVQTLVYHQQAKTVLQQRTNGDADAVSEATISEVLERIASDYRRPAEEAAATERVRAAEAEGERDRLARDLSETRSERSDLQAKIDELTAWKQEGEAKAARTRERRRQAAACFAGAVFAIACILAVFARFLEPSRPVGASILVAGLVGATLLISWGFRLNAIRNAWRMLIAAGAGTAIWFALYGVLPAESSDSGGRPTHFAPGADTP